MLILILILTTLLLPTAQPLVAKRKVVIGGALKNIGGNHLKNHVPKLLQLGKSIGEFHLIFYEDGSTDDTKRALHDLLGNKHYATVIYGKTIAGNRPTRIAHARNRILDTVKQRFSHFDFLIMTDMDGVCGGDDPNISYNATVFKDIMDRSDEYDGVGFRYKFYWDLWALRHSTLMPYNHWGRNRMKNQIQLPKDVEMLFVGRSHGELIPVESAFMMLFIYKIEAIGDSRYYAVDEYGDMDCEHVAFNKAIGNIKIANMQYCDDYPS